MTDDCRERLGLGGAVVPLTWWERDVLTASARGASVRQVAGELALHEDRVRAYLASAICKLGARSKLEAVLIALRRGDIDP